MKNAAKITKKIICFFCLPMIIAFSLFADAAPFDLIAAVVCTAILFLCTFCEKVYSGEES